MSGIGKPTITNSAGGLEVWTAQFVLETAKRGHEIDLYAVNGSLHNDNIHLFEISPSLPDLMKHISMLENNAKMKEEIAASLFTKAMMMIKDKEAIYDLIIDSCSFPSFTLNTGYFKKPTLVIGHFPVNFAFWYTLPPFSIPENTTFILPSTFQKEKAIGIPEVKKHVIPHGIDLSKYSFDESGSDQIIWLSRIHKVVNKGIADAIKTATLLEKKLRIFAYLEESSREYYQKEIKPLMNSYVSIEFAEENTTTDKNAVFGESKLFLFPIHWEEPFGLVMIESMATGTPVVTYARGSVPEIIKDGETGFIVNPSDEDIRGNWITKKTGVEGLCEAVKHIYSLSPEKYTEMRKACRLHVVKYFSVEQMVDQYIELYKKILHLQ